MRTIARAILKVLGVAALEAAPVAVASVAPWAAPIMQMIMNSIFGAEKLMGNGTGDSKRAVVTLSLASAEPLIEQMLAVHGRSITNPDLFAAGIAKVREGMVDLLNATGSLGAAK